MCGHCWRGRYCFTRRHEAAKPTSGYFLRLLAAKEANSLFALLEGRGPRDQNGRRASAPPCAGIAGGGAIVSHEGTKPPSHQRRFFARYAPFCGKRGQFFICIAGGSRAPRPKRAESLRPSMCGHCWRGRYCFTRRHEAAKPPAEIFCALCAFLRQKRPILYLHCWRVAGPATEMGGAPPPLHGCLAGESRSKNILRPRTRPRIAFFHTKPRRLTWRRQYQASSIQQQVRSRPPGL
jgi:hypothetical protein